MPITEYQREQRRKHIGSSDVAAILGVSPYATAWDIAAYKLGKADEPDLSENAAVIAGTNFEDGVIAEAERRLGTRITRNQYRSYPPLHLGANIDGLTEDDIPVEAKVVGLLRYASADEWGEDGSDQVPDQHIVQCHVHMICAGTDLCHLMVFIGGRGWALYRIERDVALVETIGAACVDFWNRYIVTGTLPSPDEVKPTLAVARRLKREPEKIAATPDDAIARWRMAKAYLTDARKQCEQAEADLLALMQDAEAAQSPTRGAVTYYETQRKGYTVEPSTYRRLTYKEKGL